METAQPVDWSQLVFGGDWIKQLENAATKRFGQKLLAEEAVTYTLEQLSADNWKRLHSFRGKSHPAHYLNSVSSNLVEEFSRKKFGRPRPPVWLTRNGNTWVGIWQQLCLERQPEQSIIDRWITESRLKNHIASIIAVIKAKMPWCGVKTEEIPESVLTAEDETNYFDEISSSYVDDEDDIHQSLENLLLLIRLLLGRETHVDSILKKWDFNSEKLAQLNKGLVAIDAKIAMSAEEVLMIKLIYLENFSQKQVAEAIGVPAYQLNRQLKALLQRIKQALSNTEEIREWLTRI